MRIEQPDFWIEISKEKVSEVYSEVNNNKHFFIDILGFKYVAVAIESKGIDYSYDNTRYFLNLKRYIVND